MKNNFKLITVTLLILISVFYLYKTNLERSIKINKETKSSVSLCGKNYNITQTDFNTQKITEIFETVDYNRKNDNFPKPNSGDKIYENLSEESQYIKYSLRPKTISDSICLQLNKESSELVIENIKIENNILSFILNKNIALNINLDNNKIYANPNLNDMSGMGGYSDITH